MAMKLMLTYVLIMQRHYMHLLMSIEEYTQMQFQQVLSMSRGAATTMNLCGGRLGWQRQQGMIHIWPRQKLILRSLV